MSWKTNPVMEWSEDGTTWVKISDHGRSPLSITPERIEKKQRMADGTLRRYVIAKKRSFSCSWDHFPSKTTTFLAGGQPGDWMEEFHNRVNGAFYMRLRSGNDIGIADAANLVRTGDSNEQDYNEDRPSN
jgi:hypothetical protein